ncbi:hypothetical protein AK812_SmicGene44934 [Symbiodinium microadriaticum]|uniref:Uncharacterized protein n=1 Tax=Symbiodinium microadriaticum TaxID=2951 RepID=A0A1Q9BX77_SYMMI|nr:hypothetical protein AK812_SmicGene44934 [Symbiodinium microadriaticum]
MSIFLRFLDVVNWQGTMFPQTPFGSEAASPGSCICKTPAEEFASMTLDAPSGSEAVLEQVLASARRQRRRVGSGPGYMQAQLVEDAKCRAMGAKPTCCQAESGGEALEVYRLSKRAEG